jgi:hypothetical protein
MTTSTTTSTYAERPADASTEGCRSTWSGTWSGTICCIIRVRTNSENDELQKPNKMTRSADKTAKQSRVVLAGQRTQQAHSAAKV